MKRGRFITLEGGEGSGKSTQTKRLAAWLGEQGITVEVTREPGGSPRAELLRELLLRGVVARFGVDAEALVFAIARADHVAEMIAPALDRGTWVISDRFLDSTWAYQGTAGVDRDRLAELDRLAVGDTRPDLTLILDLPAQSGLARMHGRNRKPDRFERDSLRMHEARREAYLDIAAREPLRCAVIDASGDEEKVARAIETIVGERLIAANGDAG